MMIATRISVASDVDQGGLYRDWVVRGLAFAPDSKHVLISSVDDYVGRHVAIYEAAAGKHRKGKLHKTVPQDELLPVLLAEIDEIAAEHGADVGARLASPSVTH